MSQYGLNALLRPASIAVIGASIHPHRAGYLMMRNLLDGGFTGPVLPVSPRHKAVCGVLAYPDIASLPLTPDLAILCTHARHTPTLLQQLGERGCRAVIVLSGHASDHEQLRQLAQQYRLRLLGPNSLGILAPWQGLNASFSPVSARPGKLAFVSQSTAVATTVLDWAAPRQIGFSHFIALGDGLDVDVDDLLDYLASDSKTSAILLYLEQLTDARRFLSAARAAARNKPILVVKSGRSAAARALLDAQGLDSAYDAAFARAGLLRVRDTHELFAAVETLHHNLKVRGERLAIISNGAAPAAMAVDELISRGGKLATFSAEERQRLHLPATTNPIPLNLGDAACAEHYLAALQMVLDSDQCDAILLLHAPSAISPATDTAERITAFLHTHPKGKHKDILTCWSGEQVSLQARQHFAATGLPTYRTVESAVAAFMHRVEYKRNQKQLMETPVSLAGLPIDTSAAQSLLSQACAQQQWQLDTCQVRAILQAYNLTVQPALPATDAAEAVILAEQLGYPV
ncbi:MAG: acetate--CoA ligase family protein, partial [Plesiomonas shigelloides]